MGCQILEVMLPTDYTESALRQAVARRLGIREFSYTIEKKSLDARHKRSIQWQLRLVVSSNEFSGACPEPLPAITIPYRKRKETAVVVGCGPAGFFAAFVLQRAGIQTTLIERGTDVTHRAADITYFEQTGIFNPASNYAFGEGGAGTFSDGKLTTRSKHLVREKRFILSSYIEAGARQEIAYMAHPHLGSDNLQNIVKNLRQFFLEKGGTIHFKTTLNDIIIKNKRIVEIHTTNGVLAPDYIVIAPGHSAFDTYRMLMRRGIPFCLKHFALGSRVEHRQTLINRAQWGCASLPGLTAAEYRLIAQKGKNIPVFTFCMCPGGVVVPAAAFEHTNIVNGMSLYARRGVFANAACVADVHINDLLRKEATTSEALDWLEALEQKFYAFSGGYNVPCCRIRDFIEHEERSVVLESSYPLGLRQAPLWNLLPSMVSSVLGEGLKDFSRKIKGFEQGTIMGLESKTSSPLQAVRERDGRSTGFENIYIVGEGSGYAGGIISSAADGIRTALAISER